MFGLQHKLSGRWIGQTALAGSLACSATKFSAREEWEVSDTVVETNRKELLMNTHKSYTWDYYCFSYRQTTIGKRRGYYVYLQGGEMADT
jgi:hypothetical protein